MGHFIDKRDAGYFTVTHIYLLVGCATPLWLMLGVSDSGNLDQTQYLPPYPHLTQGRMVLISLDMLVC